MEAARQLPTFLLMLLAVQLARSQNFERCAYMTAIPREPRPDDFPEENFDGVSWAERPLIPAPDRPDLCMDEYFDVGRTQIILMDEEIEGDIAIAQFNYQGSETPYIVQTLMGNRNVLGPEIRQVDGVWYLYITNKQDYETPSMQRYMFTISVDDEPLSVTVTLVIVNIDDNPPIVYVLDTCQVPELGEPRLTDCQYEVFDADGEISTRFMRFEIGSDRADDEVFYIQGSNREGDWYWMDMSVGIHEALDFEMSALHIFTVTAFDSLPNNQTVTLMVQVVNVEHRPPRWVEVFAVQQFDEKTTQDFRVRAIDGDTGINKPIYYRIETAEEDDFFNITNLEGGRSGAIFHVDPIDRDTLERDIFYLSIIAYKDDGEFSTSTNVVIIVNDINDQFPEPLFEEYYVEILEETPLTVNFDQEFGFHDRDIGQNAQYKVHLEDVYPPGAASAFYVAPEVGYQRQTFTMGTVNHTMLDYEVEEFQHIIIRVVATDQNDTSLVGEALVYIDLINWNDELPIFEVSTQLVSFNETEGTGFFVANVSATDRDVGDRVEHFLMGTALNYLDIDIDSGAITVKIDDAFDYHRQNEIYVQVQATDTLQAPYHTTTSQLVIQLLDINNTPPTLRLPIRSPIVEENVPEGYLITEGITATDPDTTAVLVFEIEWETSYATKQGRSTDPIEYVDCVTIQTVYPVPDRMGSAIGRVVVQEIRDNVTIDFEMFEVLYLTVRVVDLNTLIGDTYDQLTFTVIIEDMNDNPPVWTEGSLETAFRVRELSESDVVIGSVHATDIDGPMYNQVRYTIRTREDTPEGLVKIDFYSGQINVNTSYAIDADTPPRHHLYYTVIASDRCYVEPEDCPGPDPNYFEIPGNITISIIDTNNKIPREDTTMFNKTVYIYEKSVAGTEVVTLFSIDEDRDEIYNNVRYQINYAFNSRLRDFFSIDLDTGLVYVHYTTDELLDRDNAETEHRIFITLIDNFYTEGDGNMNQNDTEVLVVLLDINDNAPELPTPDELSWDIYEDLLAGVRLERDIYAPDIDEPDTDNSRVGYAILNLTCINRDINPLPELFGMIQIQNVTGELETLMDLKGYWGTYNIHILAYDHGTPQQMSNETYEMVIHPYNYNQPRFTYPQPGTTIRLAKERAIANGLLATVGGDFMDSIAAEDDDGLHAGQVTFEVVGNDEATNFFEIRNFDDVTANQGYLMLTQLFPEDTREFQVTIRATDGGTRPDRLSAEETLHVVFVPTQGTPVFTTTAVTVAFFEQEGGLEESFTLPMAEDPKNYLCTDDCLPVYYHIVGGNDEGLFSLDPELNVLRLAAELDREVADHHTLVVAAGNSEQQTGFPSSTLTVTVNVREADPRPVFTRHLHTAGISTLDTINRELLTIQAVHTEQLAITYSIDLETMQVDSTLEAVKNSAFEVNPQTGILYLRIQPTAAMHGMFEFQVLATDSVGASDRADVKIYLISTLNRVIFIFVNTVEQIENNRDFIAQTFTAGFGMTCNIDQVVPATDSSGLPLDTHAEIRAHFIHDDVPVSADDVEQLRSDTQLLRAVQMTLNTELLVLQDFVTDINPIINLDASRTAMLVLAGLAAFLGLMCVVLLVAYFLRTRTLNRRLEAMSTHKYDSMGSGLNNAGLAAPGTNKHATVGSNPIWNAAINAPDFDALSNESYDSDLIGIEDLPQFAEIHQEDEADNTPGIVGGDGVATHNNNFGFNATPFNKQFSGGQYDC